jgi:hypothetical protein
MPMCSDHHVNTIHHARTWPISDGVAVGRDNELILHSRTHVDASVSNSVMLLEHRADTPALVTTSVHT